MKLIDHISIVSKKIRKRNKLRKIITKLTSQQHNKIQLITRKKNQMKKRIEKRIKRKKIKSLLLLKR